MSVLASIIFLDFNLPNAATWFYFSLLLAVGLFFKFSRFFSVRNLDVLALFLLVPGLLLRQEAYSAAPEINAGPTQFGAVGNGEKPDREPSQKLLLWFAYLGLLGGSAFLFARCLFDLPLVRRPALSPNLNLAGLAWLGCTFFIFLTAVAFRHPATEPPGVMRKGAVALDQAQKQVEALVPNEVLQAGQDSAVTRQAWVDRSLAILCHLAIVIALVLIGWRHFQDLTAGMAAATFYLLLPYTAYHVALFHAEPEHVWPTALLLWAVAAYRVPVVSGLFLGLGAGSVYFPALLLPLWLSFYRKRGAGRFLGAFLFAAGLSLAIVGIMLWSEGRLTYSLQSALNLSDWQPWKEPTGEGFWTGVPWAWAYRIPVFILFLAFVLTTAFWPSPKNLAHVLALSAAILIGIQFWYADKGGLYVLWYLPILLLLVFRPNLSDRVPPPIQPQTDRLAHLGRMIARWTGTGVAKVRTLLRAYSPNRGEVVR